jgi:Cu(I)/Ag(I) efflux system membrane fusion protein
MDLVPMMKRNGASDSSTVQVSQFTVPVERQQRFGVSYTKVWRRPMRFEIRSVGTLEPDAGRVFEYVTHGDCYIQSLNVSSPGERVSSGQALLTIYSPNLRGAEQELVSLLTVQNAGTVRQGSLNQLVDAARHRLRLWNVSQNEIDELERTRQPTDELILRSPFDGVVERVTARTGLSVRDGDKLLTIIDLSKLWLWADFYETEANLLNLGQLLHVTLPASPAELLEGKISVIGPSVDPAKRTIRVRIDLLNPQGQLRPGMYANVIAEINCGEGLVIPVDAVLPTGSRMLVFVDQGEGRLETRFIQVGREFADLEGERHERYYEVISGLNEGDRVVSSGTFLIDSESQIADVMKDWQQTSQTERKSASKDEMQ